MAHVEQRGKNSWRLVVTIGYDKDDVPIRERKTIKAKNKTEAREKLTIFESSILSGEYVKPEGMTVEKLFEEWKEHVTDDYLAVRTKSSYENIIDKRIIPIYGNMLIGEIKPINVLSFVNNLKKDGARLDGKKGELSTSTINNCYKAFSHLFEFAKTMLWIDKNPTDNIKPPRTVHKKMKFIVRRNLWPL